jgi:hypothetical protein
MKPLNRFFIVLSAVLLVACGSSSSRDFTTSGLTGGTNDGTNGDPNGGTNGGSTGGIPPGLNPAPQFIAKITGALGQSPQFTTPPLRTSALLRVKVVPLPAPNMTLPGFENYSFPYGCLQLQVSVNGIPLSTQVLRVGNSSPVSTTCANSPTSEILTFSYQANTDFVVTVNALAYDSCRKETTWATRPYGCAMDAVFKNHLVSALIYVQTDGTYLP